MHNHVAQTGASKVSGLYLCQFSQGTIKVGMGVNAKARLASHRAAGAVFGISVTRTSVIPCDHMRQAEKLLIAWCVANAGGCNGREWFDGLDYEQCLEAAKSAASAMIGPHAERRPSRDLMQTLLDQHRRPATHEASIYSDARRMMVESNVSGDVINALDYLHGVSECVRANIRMGAPMPEWFELLNCFEPWEIELLIDSGRPSADLLGACADAIRTIERLEKAEVAHA